MYVFHLFAIIFHVTNNFCVYNKVCVGMNIVLATTQMASASNHVKPKLQPFFAAKGLLILPNLYVATLGTAAVVYKQTVIIV